MNIPALKDRMGQICGIIIFFIILYGTDIVSGENDENAKAAVNMAGIAYQGVGFVLIMWASSTKIHLKASAISEYEGEKSRIISAITHPKTWETGMTMILLGLFFQFIGLDFSRFNGILD